ncbi:hypothetical protein [Azohydromonas australica]|uniref:hypothetical protein n=1 Tax=Azohydromonas australica TaxID=364039 RepID=UPI00041A2F55|nr:hypothetical protein [Azohydromonas australica]
MDLNDRGVDAAVAPEQLIHHNKIKRLTKLQRHGRARSCRYLSGEPQNSPQKKKHQ